jgi:hypothetical protein
MGIITGHDLPNRREQEQDGRWIAEARPLEPWPMDLPATAIAKVKALALRAVAERLEHGEAGPDLEDIA